MQIAVVTPKGGAGKTTAAVELAIRLPGRVLLIDTDQQGDASIRLGVELGEGATTADVLTGRAEVTEAAVASPLLDHVDVLPGSHSLARLEHTPAALTALRDELPDLVGEGKRWDHVVIDTPSALGMATGSGLAAAAVIVAPVSGPEAYKEAGRLETYIAEAIRPRINKGAGIRWVVPIAWDARTVLHRNLLAAMIERWGTDQVTRPVRSTTTAKESYVAGRPVSLYAPSAPIVADFDAMASAIANAEGVTARRYKHDQGVSR